MTRLTDILPPDRLTRPEQRALDEARGIPPGQAGLGQGIDAAVNVQSIIPWAVRRGTRGAIPPDYDFKLTPESLKQLTQDIPEPYWDAFEGVQSEEEARLLRMQLLDVAASRETLSRMGLSGTLLEIGAAVIDPVAIAAGMGVGGAAKGIGAFRALSAGTRVQRMVAGGLATASTEVPIEAYLVANDPLRDWRDIAWSAVGSLGLGGLAGLASTAGRAERVTGDIRRQLDLQAMSEAGVELSVDGKQILVKSRDGSVASRIVDEIDADDATRADIASAINNDLSVTVPGAMGAASRQELSGAAKSGASATKFRFGMVARMQTSQIPGLRRIAPLIAEDVLPNRAGNAVQYSASEKSMRLSRVDMTRYHRSRNANFGAWAKKKGVNSRLNIAAQREFDERVGRAVRGELDNDPQVRKMAAEVSALNREMLKRAKEAGVRGFEEVPENANYLTRVWSKQKIADATKRLGHERVVKTLANSIVRGSDDIDESKAETLAKALLRAINSRDYTSAEIAGAFGGDSSELLRRVLTDTGELTDAQIDDILGEVKRTPTEAPLTSRGKRRVRLDETYSEGFNFRILDEDIVSTLSISDLLENNASTITAVYTRQMNGAIAFQGVLDAFKRSADDDLSSWDALRTRFEREAAEVGASKADFETNMKRLDILQRSVRGLPLSDQSAFNEGLRILRHVQFVRVMNQVGFAQVAELDMIVGEMGVRTMLQQMPALARLTRDAKTGRISNELGRELENLLGIGTNFMRNEVLARFDHETFIPESTKIITGLERMNRVTSAISGMATIDDGLRKFSGLAAAQKWHNFSQSGRLPSDLRLAGMGLTRDQAKGVLAEMKKHATAVDGAFGKRLESMNIEKWDPDVAANFTVSLDKWTRRVIQDNDIGSMSMWMTTELGRNMIQFRTFVLNAWERQTLYGLKQRDLTAFTAFAGSSFFGTMAYIAQTYAQSIGRDDREEFLEKRLNPWTIAKAGFQRTGFTSLFPPAIDSAAAVTGFEPVFNNYARTTGLASGAITGSPTVDFFDNAYRAVKGTVSAAVQPDDDFSQRDLDSIFRLLPFQNALGVQNVLRKISGTLPEE